MKIEKDDYGKKLVVELEEAADRYTLTLPVESKFFDHFCAKIGNVDRSQLVTIAPYSFVPKGEAHKKSGLNFFQNGVKCEYYFTEKNPQGKPMPASAKLDEDDWKMFKMQERKFYCEYIAKLDEKPEPRPTYTTGQRGDLLLSARGALAVCGFGAAGADGVSNGTLGFMYAQNNTAGYLSATANYVFNGTSWDRDRKASGVSRVASSAASGNPAFAKASAGDLKHISGQNGAAITYIHFYNKATAPTLGTDTPVISFAIPANANFNIPLPDRGLYFGTGIAYAFTTDIATIPTTGAAAAAITAFAAVYA